MELCWVSARVGPGRRRSGKPEAGKIGDFKISLAEWSLHKALFAKKIDNLDFPKIAREEYGIEGVEFVNQFFKDKAHDSAYLKDLKKRANDVGVTCVLIMIDGEGDLSATQGGPTDESGRKPQEVGRRRGGAGLPRDPGQHGRALQPHRRRRRRRGLRHLDRLRRQERDLDHLREPRRTVQQPRRAARPDEGRRQADLRHASRLRQLPPGQSRELHDRRLRRDRPDDAVCQGRLGQELRLRRIRAKRPSSTTPGS